MPYGSVDARKIDNWIARVEPGAPLAGHGASFVEQANRNGVSPYLLAAIARKETQFGKTSGKFRYNPGGWGVHLGPSVNTSRSWDEGIGKIAKGLSGSLYKGSGLTRASDILMKYAPPSENNTQQYIDQVNSWMRELGADPNANVFGSAANRKAGLDTLASPATGEAQNESPTGGLVDSVSQGLATRQPGQSLFDNVVQSVMSTALGQPALTQRKGVEVNPAGNGPAQGGEKGVVGAARRYLGTPYSWGGGTPSGPSRGFAQGANTVGFDCSSLVQMAWSKMGVSLPRTTYGQIKVGQGINAKNPAAWQPGDLMFPSTGHVQMYVGNGKVIEAPRTGGVVQVVPVRSSYIAVRRPG